MELKTLISETINQILESLAETAKSQDREIYLESPSNQSVIFDLAISFEEQNQKEVKINVLRYFGGGISEDNKSVTTNRIHFSVYVDNKTKTERAQEQEKIHAVKKYPH